MKIVSGNAGLTCSDCLPVPLDVHSADRPFADHGSPGLLIEPLQPCVLNQYPAGTAELM
jgi:hypothetical protein